MAQDSMSVVTTVEKVRTIVLSKNDILELLRRSEVPIPGADRPAHVPITNDECINDAEVTFQVPGGADWSGMTIDIDRDHPVTVTLRWRETTRG